LQPEPCSRQRVEIAGRFYLAVPLGEPAAEASIETSRSENAWDFCFDQKLLEIYGEEKLGSVADSD
jgi:hypothetical protein